MDRVTAEERLWQMCAADQEPALSDVQVTLLVDQAELSGWNLRSAAAEGWRWKAAACAGQYGFSVDGSRFDRDQMHAMCLRMAALYDGQGGGVATLQSPTATLAASVGPDLSGLWPC